MRRTLAASAVLGVVWALAACSPGSGPTTLEKDALAVTTAAARHDVSATTAAAHTLRADVAAAQRSGTLDAARALAIDSAAQQVLADLRGPAPTPPASPSTTAPTAPTPSGGDTKGKDKQGNGNGDSGGGGGGGD